MNFFEKLKTSLKGSRIKRKTSDASSENESQRVIQRVNERQQMIISGTKRDNELCNK